MTQPAVTDRHRRSYSQLSQITGCGKRFQLQRRLGISSIPGWWNAGGKAVHSGIEAWLLVRHAEENSNA